ncbi:RNA ligase [Nocardia jiangxiensis]|uniref:RNA ligase n=1 Tax=Nocardia jiangxiensis TaxID=282685 RepID=UPI00031A6F0C|nr:RNA ligase [Nocardia jiangxiensis]
MTYISDLMDEDLLADMIERKYIRFQNHPFHSYSIYCYTEHAQYDRMWNDATMRCRGLIADHTGTILARPFPKFFNDSEHLRPGMPILDFDAPVEVTDKLDGSLGISYPVGRGGRGSDLRIATKGSFKSDQAAWANTFYLFNYAPYFQPDPALTYLFEIIYAANRIVVDYNYNDLVLLGAIEISTGRFIPASEIDWPGGRVKVFTEYRTLQDVIDDPEARDNAEGFVIRFLDSGMRVKIKYDEYLRLHRIVTGLSEKMVWEHATAGQPLETLVAPLPDEFHGWVSDVWIDLHQRYSDTLRAAQIAFRDEIAGTPGLPRSEAKKEFALAIKDRPVGMKNLLFPMQQIDAEIWKQLEPCGDTRLFNAKEE